MGLCEEDRILTKRLYEFKGYGAKRLIKEFPTKRWKMTTLNDFFKYLKEQCTNGRKCENFSYSSKHHQRQRSCSEPGRNSPDAFNIVTDCQKTGIHPLSAVRIIRENLRLQV